MFCTFLGSFRLSYTCILYLQTIIFHDLEPKFLPVSASACYTHIFWYVSQKISDFKNLQCENGYYF